jgi:hypothetical protein
MLVDRRQTQVFEDRHELGDRRRPVAQEDTETPLLVDGVERPPERRRDAFGLVGGEHLGDVHEVADSRAGTHPRLVVGRDGAAHLRPDPLAFDGTEHLDEFVAGAFGPCRRRPVDLGDEIVGVVEFGSPDRHREPGERAGTQQRLEVSDLAAVVLRHDRCDAVGKRGGEA